MAIGTLSANRFNDPSPQFCDETGTPYAGGKLYFYVTGTSTPLNTYSDPDLNDATHANTNPVVLDSAGRTGTIFIEARLYKVVLKDSSDNVIWTMDPVATSDMTTFAKLQTYAGDPNGNVAGTAGTGSTPSSAVWDRTNNRLYVCTTTGSAAAAVWTRSEATLSGSIVFTGVISPTALAANTNNWAPTDFASAYQVRVQASSAIDLTGIAGGAVGRKILLTNIGSNTITLVANSGS